jgi:hypothetical protein
MPEITGRLVRASAPNALMQKRFAATPVFGPVTSRLEMKLSNDFVA